MAHRVLFLTIETSAGEAVPCFFKHQATSGSHGPLKPVAAREDIYSNARWLESIGAAQKVMCAVGNEWLPSIPARYRGMAVAEHGGRWEVCGSRGTLNNSGLAEKPSTHGVSQRAASGSTELNCNVANQSSRSTRHATCVVSLLNNLPEVQPSWPALRCLKAVEFLTRNEPWDFMAVCLNVEGISAVEMRIMDEVLLALAGALSPGVVLVTVQVRDGNCEHWFSNVNGGSVENLPERSIGDVLQSVLSFLDIADGDLFSNVPPVVKAACNSSPYSHAEELEIQHRLEDLGYL